MKFQACEAKCTGRDAKGSLTYNVCISNCYHTMDLSSTDVQQDFKLPKSLKNAVSKAKTSLGMKELNEKKKTAKKAAVMKTLDQLITDYGMEGEMSVIDMNRPVPFNGMGAYGAGFEGEWSYGAANYGYGEAAYPSAEMFTFQW